MIEASVRRCSHQEGCLGRRPLRKCGNRVDKGHIILIDLESDSGENIVLIDSHDSFPSKTKKRLRRGEKIASSWKDVICLDDDENADGLRSGETSSDSSSPCKNSSPSNFRSSSAAEKYGCQAIHENISPVRLSKGKRTYSVKDSATNQFGLGDTHYMSSDDFLDSDLMEDSCGGNVKEMWERAYSKRKRKLLDDQPIQGDSDKDSDGSHKNVNISSEYRQCEETPCVTKKAEDEAAPSSNHKKKGHSNCASADSLSATADGSEDILMDSVLKKHFACRGNDDNHTQGSGFEFAECSSGNIFEPSSTHGRMEEEQGPKGPSFPREENGTRQVEHVKTPFNEDSNASLAEPCSSRSGSFTKDNVCVPSVDSSEKEPPAFLHEQNSQRSSTQSYEVNGIKNPIKDSMSGQDGQAMVYNEVLMIGDREKLKETDEYKKAMEKELASRQQALKIQAEEAQNLRRLQKRMKAERMRLLDMEKRQKQRVEEIRETQKKDEENSNVKEIIRAEVRKDLNKLEVTCLDMASLLRGLGISVGDGVLPPLLSEVRYAYKRALLSLHPDRASRSDIRQQVEAEEKFKLISRMKERFLL